MLMAVIDRRPKDDPSVRGPAALCTLLTCTHLMTPSHPKVWPDQSRCNPDLPVWCNLHTPPCCHHVYVRGWPVSFAHVGMHGTRNNYPGRCCKGDPVGFGFVYPLGALD